MWLINVVPSFQPTYHSAYYYSCVDGETCWYLISGLENCFSCFSTYDNEKTKPPSWNVQVRPGGLTSSTRRYDSSGRTNYNWVSTSALPPTFTPGTTWTNRQCSTGPRSRCTRTRNTSVAGNTEMYTTCTALIWWVASCLVPHGQLGGHLSDHR